MDVKVARVTPGSKKGTLSVRLNVKTHGRPSQAFTTVVDKPRKFVMGQGGTLKTADGQWRTPLRVIDGKWRFSPDPEVEWAEDELTEDEVQALIRPHLEPFHHRHVVDHCNDLGFGEYKMFGMRIVPIGNVHIDPETKHVQVFVTAFDALTGKPLNVGDGCFQAKLPPMSVDGTEENPRDAFRVVVAQLIRGLN